MSNRLTRAGRAVATARTSLSTGLLSISCKKTKIVDQNSTVTVIILTWFVAAGVRVVAVADVFGGLRRGVPFLNRGVISHAYIRS